MVRTGKSLQCLNHSSLSSCLFSVHLEAKQRSGGCRNEPSAVSPPAPVWSATVFSWEGRDGSIAVSSQIPVAAAAKSLQSCPTLCDPIDGSPPGSPVPGILQARTLEWVAIAFSSAWKWKVKVKSLSPVWLSATPWTAAHQAPPSMGFSRQEYWSGVPLPSPQIPVTEPTFQASAGERWIFCSLAPSWPER